MQTVMMMDGGSVLILFKLASLRRSALLFGIIFPAPFFLHNF